MDESGLHKGSKVTVIGGVVAEQEAITRLEMRWREILAEMGAPYFHSRELEHMVGAYGPLDRVKRNYLWKWLPEAIAEEEIGLLASSVLTDDLAYVCAKHPSFAKWFSEPYNFCFDGCLQGAVGWSSKFAAGAPVAFVFSEQNQFRKNALRVFAAYSKHPEYQQKMDSIDFRDMRFWPALQAADLICSEFYRTVVEVISSSISPERSAIDRIMDLRPDRDFSGGLVTKADMEQWIAEGPKSYFDIE